MTHTKPLASLRADFRRERRAYQRFWIEYEYRSYEGLPALILIYLMSFIVLLFSASFYAKWEKRDSSRNLVTSAERYSIAREHGLQAAMLYKLSDGAIDPRKDGAA